MLRRGGTAAEAGIYLEEGQFIGFLLGADFCAEHEHGIAPLERSFGTVGEEDGFSTGVCGVERYQSTTYDPDCLWFRQRKSGEEAVLVYHLSFKSFTDKKKKFPQNLDKFCAEFSVGMYDEEILKKLDREPETLATAWKENGFAIHVKGKENVKRLKDLKKAIEKNDILIFVGAPALAAFSRGSLTITIASCTPEEGKRIMKESHEATIKLYDDASKTGIFKKIQDSEKRYFALTPKRRGDKEFRLHPETREREDMPESEHDIVFYLNPYHQRLYHSGWFTVEELEQWINDEGIILKERSKDANAV